VLSMGAETGTELESMPSREGATGGLDRASGFPFPLENSVRRVFPSTASNGPSAATFDDVPGLSAVHTRLMTPSYTRPQLSLPGIRDPRRDYPFENLPVQCGTTPSNSNTSIQRPLARQRVLLSRRVIAYYGLIRASESLPATYGFAAGSAAPKENRLEVGIQRFPN